MPRKKCANIFTNWFGHARANLVRLTEFFLTASLSGNVDWLTDWLSDRITGVGARDALPCKNSNCQEGEREDIASLAVFVYCDWGHCWAIGERTAAFAPPRFDIIAIIVQMSCVVLMIPKTIPLRNPTKLNPTEPNLRKKGVDIGELSAAAIKVRLTSHPHLTPCPVLPNID